MRIESWKPVPGYEGLYEVSDRGRVRSLTRTIPHLGGSRVQVGRVLRTRVRPDGHFDVWLSVAGNGRRCLVHVLVATAFLGASPGPEYEVCHNDGVGTHNDLTNLRWDTHSENMRDVRRHGGRPPKTHCPAGHALTGEAVYVQPNGARACRVCRNERSAAWSAKRRAA